MGRREPEKKRSIISSSPLMNVYACSSGAEPGATAFKSESLWIDVYACLSGAEPGAAALIEAFLARIIHES